MDQKVEIKKEPVWLDGSAGTSFENFKHDSAVTCLREESKPVCAEVRPSQPAAGVKDEVNIEEQTIAQLVPCFKEESNLENVALLSRGPLDTCDIMCKLRKRGTKKTFTLPPQNMCYSEERPNVPIRKRKFWCDHCGKSCFRKTDLRKHLLVHTEERPHACNQCDKKFKLKSDVLKHLLVHTGERPHSCNHCGKAFSDKSNLRKHLLSHTGMWTHLCGQCGRGFSRKSTLEAHLNIHAGVRPYLCKAR
ncbi:zinc finger protein 239-like [Anabrus simplex]|uniref:zinc finger protein 239-like n=1 Tax=Anabrus simplex TaxID=316456 RepID=UPI0035A2E761